MSEPAKKVNRPDFFQIPTLLLDDDDIRPSDCFVYAVVYWYSKLRLEKCTASNESIASLAKVSTGAVANSLVRLSKKGYIKVILDDSNHRLEIIPLIIFGVTPSSNDDPPFIKRLTPPSSNDEQNKNINNKNSYITNTNVLAETAKVDKRDPDISEGIEVLEQLLTHPVQKQTYNRYALKRLYRSRGKERTLNALKYAFMIQSEDRFSPQIFNFMDLEDKWDHLEAYGRKKAVSAPRAVNVADILRQQKGDTAHVTQDS